MKLPIILTIDDDPQVLRALQRDLRQEFRDNYRVMSAQSASDALATLQELKKQGEDIAMLLSDQRMPEMQGVEFLEKAKVFFPQAKRVLLTAYSDIEAAIKAINDVQLNYYLTKPWDPPEERLFPVIKDLLEDWQASYNPDYKGLRVIGYQYSPLSHDLKDFLAGNLFPYQWLDFFSNEKAREILQLHKIPEAALPVVVLENGEWLSKPDKMELATRLGLKVIASQEVYDVVIIGAGPAGLAAAVYGGSEGLKTLLIEKRAPGGQAGTSSRIENYLGFPSGLSGADLARRAVSQAARFGVEFLAPQEVINISLKESYKILKLSNGNEVVAKSLIFSTGVDYRKLSNEGLERLAGAGVYYGAATTEAYACTGKEVYVVGGGNSAGQGAVYLARYASKVFIVIRRIDLAATMSQYLIDQIQSLSNVFILPQTEVVAAAGDSHLEKIILESVTTKERWEGQAGALFIFIGAKPETDWIGLSLLRDDKGFLVTGRDLLNYKAFAGAWKLERNPYLLETCIPGIFAAGDVRSGAMNRVASAVGEGAMAISFVHKYLAEI